MVQGLLLLKEEIRLTMSQVYYMVKGEEEPQIGPSLVYPSMQGDI